MTDRRPTVTPVMWKSLALLKAPMAKSDPVSRREPRKSCMSVLKSGLKPSATTENRPLPSILARKLKLSLEVKPFVSNLTCSKMIFSEKENRTASGQIAPSISFWPVLRGDDFISRPRPSICRIRPIFTRPWTSCCR